MAPNFSLCKGSYVLNQFPSNVMFGMNGFHVSVSGAIQGHHGPLVFNSHPKFYLRSDKVADNRLIHSFPESRVINTVKLF